MRRGAIVLFVFLLLCIPARAEDTKEILEEDFGASTLESALDSQTREALSGLTPTSGGDFGAALLRILSSALETSGGAIQGAARAAGKVLAAAILCSFASMSSSPGVKSAANAAGALAITGLCAGDIQSMVALARQTVEKTSDFTALLLPVLSGALAGAGGTSGAGALLAGGNLVMSILTKLSLHVLIPLVYGYILLSAAKGALEDGSLGNLRELLGHLISLFCKGTCLLFTAYLSLSRVFSASADSLTLKATQAAFSGMVPVVGSILADASQSLMAGAGLICSAAGLFGVLAIAAIAVAPFLKLGIYYLALRLAGALSACAASPCHAGLILDLASAMGYMLAIVGSTSAMALCAAACFIKAVSG